MATLTLNLPPSLDQFVEDEVASGAYADAEDLALTALRLLERRRAARARKVQRLRAALQVAVDQLDRGEGLPIHDQAAWLDTLGHRASKSGRDSG